MHNDLMSGQEFRYSYDAADRVINAVSKPTVAGHQWVNTTNTYNDMGLLSNVTREIDGVYRLSMYGYTGTGRLLNEYYAGIWNIYRYDDFGRVWMNSVEKANGTVVLKREFTFAPAPRPTLPRRVSPVNITAAAGRAISPTIMIT